MKSLLIICMFALAASGCSVFTPPKEIPVIEDKLGAQDDRRAGTLAITPERRVITVDLMRKDRLSFCAEPSPDVAESISSSFRAAIERSASGPGTQTQASAEVSKAFATAITSLFKRSQGIQLYRDGAFVLCQGLMNNAISNDAFQRMLGELLSTSSKLIDKEIPSIVEKNVEEMLKQAQNARDEAARHVSTAKSLQDSSAKSADAAGTSATSAKSSADAAARSAQKAADEAAKK